MRKAARLLHRLRGGKLLQLTGLMDEVISESIGWAPYTAVANMTGRPAVSITLHWTASGLPLGVQLLGRLGADGGLLQVAAQAAATRHVDGYVLFPAINQFCPRGATL